MSVAALSLVNQEERSGSALARPQAEPLHDLREACPNWRRGLRCELPTGERVPVRCKSPNRCRYCGAMTAVENAGVLHLDAQLGEAPRVGITLTTLRPITDAELREHTAVFWRAFRRRWGAVEYCGFVEWTTGRSERSGGKRRIHLHYLVKGLALGAGSVVTRAPELERAARTGAKFARSVPCKCGDPATCVECWTRAEWRKLVGAWVVEARELRTPAGATAYLALHHAKQDQAPPAGWSGKRFRPSRGYFNAPIAQLRDRVQRELARARAEHGDRPVQLRELLPKLTPTGSEIDRVRRLLAPPIVPHEERDEARLRHGELVNLGTGEVYPRTGGEVDPDAIAARRRAGEAEAVEGWGEADHAAAHVRDRFGEWAARDRARRREARTVADEPTWDYDASAEYGRWLAVEATGRGNPPPDPPDTS